MKQMSVKSHVSMAQIVFLENQSNLTKLSSIDRQINNEKNKIQFLFFYLLNVV